MPLRVSVAVPRKSVCASTSVSAGKPGMPFTLRRRTVPSGALNVTMKQSRSRSCTSGQAGWFFASRTGSMFPKVRGPPLPTSAWMSLVVMS
jgi:hypothetical protein